MIPVVSPHSGLRPAYSERFIDYLLKCVGIEDVKLICSVEPLAYKLETMKEIRRFSNCTIVENQKQTPVFLNFLQLGALALLESDFFIFCEEDVVLYKDALNFYLFARSKLLEDENLFTATACGGCNDSSIFDVPNYTKVVKRRKWLHATTFSFIEKRFREIEHLYLQDNTVAQRPDEAMKEEFIDKQALTELYPLVSRANHYGFQTSIHSVSTPKRLYQFSSTIISDMFEPVSEFHELKC